jgi:hypothetical protein
MNTNNDSLPQEVATSNELRPKSKRTAIIPTSQFDVLTLAEQVANKWLQSPQITLLWMKANEFKQLVTAYSAFLKQRVEVGSGRTSNTLRLRELDSHINKAVSEAKISLMSTFGRDKAKGYFSEFGLVNHSKAFFLPKDRSQRLTNLPLFIKGIQTYNIKLVSFDESFVENLLDSYKKAMESTQTTDSAVSVSVSNKNDLRNQIVEVLMALYSIIKANYPQTYEGELRGWGFQKEKY